MLSVLLFFLLCIPQSSKTYPGSGLVNIIAIGVVGYCLVKNYWHDASAQLQKKNIFYNERMLIKQTNETVENIAVSLASLQYIENEQLFKQYIKNKYTVSLWPFVMEFELFKDQWNQLSAIQKSLQSVNSIQDQTIAEELEKIKNSINAMMLHITQGIQILINDADWSAMLNNKRVMTLETTSQEAVNHLWWIRTLNIARLILGR